MKLIKNYDGYDYALLDRTNICVATTEDKLSKDKCDLIFFDVDKIADDEYVDCYPEYMKDSFINVFKNGFNKAMNLNSDKLFTIDDIYEAIRMAKRHDEIPNHDGIIVSFDYSKEEIIKSLQKQNSLEVEVDVCYENDCYATSPTNCSKTSFECKFCTPVRMMIDEDGFLILKRK